MGTMASIDFSPVCTGWLTDCRSITPGAIFSIGERVSRSSAPPPSIGSPSELTTRPSSCRPTGTSRMRPVQRAVSPSRRWR